MAKNHAHDDRDGVSVTIFNDRRPAEVQAAAEAKGMKEHDRDRQYQHDWGICDHPCCRRCAKIMGETHPSITKKACAKSRGHI